MKKVLEIRNEIGVYNNTLNKFIKTYELKIFNLKYLNDYTLKELRDYHEVKDELYSLLISLKNSLREYSSDYYAWKSLNEIAKKIDVDINDLLAFFNENKSELFDVTFTFAEKGKTHKKIYLDIRNWENEIFTETTQVKKISSYQILKDLQLKLRWEKININL